MMADGDAPMSDKLTAAMAIVRDVAANSFPGADPGVCPFCEHGILHTPDCPVTKARALLAQKEAE